jgi:agmatinase
MNNFSYYNSEYKRNDIIVSGVPFDCNSSYRRGAAAAPVRIKEALYCESSNLCAENGTDLGEMSGWHIFPDLELSSEVEDAFVQIESEVAGFLKKGLRVIALGGDHSITLPLVRAHAQKYPKLNILHLDAHPDLYDQLGGNSYSHASPFARIMEENLAARLVQAGIRTLTPHQREQARRFGVEIIDMRNIETLKELSFDGPVYLSLDLDCLDPAFAPGVSHYEPGGMSTRDVLEIIQNLKGEIIGADIVELNPERDLNGLTAMLAGKLLKELIVKINESGS